MSEVIASYWSLEETAEGLYSELRSKFIAYVIPVRTEEEALAEVACLRQKYYDARHVCWAYRLGIDGATTRSNDDGEPSGTAGKPILGQLLSANVTEVVAVVIRYFGGVKLGTSGLIEAYREATREALSTAKKVERIVERAFTVAFGYELMGEVMRLVKDWDARVLEQEFLESCRLSLSLRADEAPKLFGRLEQIYGTTLAWSDEE